MIQCRRLESSIELTTSELEAGESRMIHRARSQATPQKLSLIVADRRIVNTSVSNTHQAVLVEFPKLVAVAAKPAAFVIVPFVAKADGDPIFTKIPQLLD